MEKYRVFGDESVGANPFIPVYYSQAQLLSHAAALSSSGLNPTSSSSIVSAAILFKQLLLLPLRWLVHLLAAALAIVRLLLLLLAGAALLLILKLISPLSFLPYLHWKLQKFLLFLPLRTALFALGILRIKEQQADFRRLKIRPAAAAKAPWKALLALPCAAFVKKNKAATATASPGLISRCRLCLCTFTSLIEPLYLAYRLAPQFVLVHAEGGFSFCSLSQIVAYSLQFELPLGKGEYSTLSALLVAHATRSSVAIPIVIFPEGQKSNGQCILQWMHAPASAAEFSASFDEAALRALEGRIAEVGCLYTTVSADGDEPFRKKRRVGYGLPHTVHSPGKHLLLAMREWRQPFLAIWATPTDVQACVRQQQQRVATTSAGGSSTSLLPLLREVMTRMLPGRCAVNKNGSDLRAFNKYWEATHGGSYKRRS